MPSGKGWKEGAAMNAIQKYFKYRQSLIDQYAKGDMTKREYLQKNYEAVVYGDIGPFRNMDTVEIQLPVLQRAGEGKQDHQHNKRYGL